jgi:prepilin-type N-terminal cleavage/methylation domain-containing protein/prepilin-type processing-associated H-X9-DG protein
MTRAARRNGDQGLRGFSLVELVVVIAIIALLAGILMPTLTLARERANQVKCMANLRSIGQAAESHLAEHEGYLPTCGWQWFPVGGVVNPVGLGDGGKRRYDYYGDEDQLRPLPVTAALAQYMGVKVHTDSRQRLEDDLGGETIAKLFTCPGQTQRLTGWTQRDSAGWTSPDEVSSYVFNEAVMGRRNRDASVYPFPDGLITKVKRASEVFLAADGRTRDPQNDRCFLVFDFGPQDSLADFETNIQQSALGKELVDHFRHRRKMNVVFLDNHVETVPTDLAGLRGVGVSRGIQ